MASWIGAGEVTLRWGSGTTDLVLVDGRELRIYWSNKYAPLEDLVLIDPSTTKWAIKPDKETTRRLTSVFVENAKDPGKVDFFIRTVFRAELVHV